MHPLLKDFPSPFETLPEAVDFPSDDSVRVIPLGGLGEVGMNLLLYETRGRILVVDCGLMFPGDEYRGTRYLIPDLSYLRANAGKVEAVFLTHGHEDHIGALPHLLAELSVPVFGTALTLGLVRSKLEEWGFQDAQLHQIEGGGTYRVGPFEIEAVPVTHSILDAVSFAIRTPQGVFFHTGDFKIDPTPMPNQRIDLERIRAIGDAGVTCLLSDSTNIEREGHTPSERAVGAALEDIFRSHDGRVLIATFSSNIDRIQQIADVSEATDRKLALFGRSLLSNVAVARELGYLKFPKGLVVPLEKAPQLEPRETCILTTGTQGEPFSALSRIASDKHPLIKVGPGDLVVLSSRTIPGNERAISRTLNGLYALGARVIYERVSEVHVSGHAAREEQREMLRLTRPEFFLPVHGETRMLVRHGDLAAEERVTRKNILWIQDGVVARFEKGAAKLEARVPAGPIAVDQATADVLGEEILAERHFLGNNGVLVVTVRVDAESGRPFGEPHFHARGISRNGSISNELSPVVTKAIVEYYEGDCDHDSVEENVIGHLRRHFRKDSPVVPLIVPVVIPG